MAQLNHPHDVFVSRGEVFIADTNNHRVRKVLWNGQIVTIAGNGTRGFNGDGQLATDAELSRPCAVVVSSSDQVYISEWSGHRIRKIDRRGIITTIAGTGKEGYNGDDQLAVNATIDCPWGLFVTDDEEVLFADCRNHRVRRIDQFGIITTIAGNGIQGFSGDGKLATIASLNVPASVFQYKDEIYIADEYNNRIRKIDRRGIITTIAGTGIQGFSGDDILATDANFGNPDSVFVHNDQIYISEQYNGRIRKILPNGIIKTIAGTGQVGHNGEDLTNRSTVSWRFGDDLLATQCKLNLPRGIFIDSSDSQIHLVM